MYFNNKDLSALLKSTDVVIFDMNGLLVDDEPIQLQMTKRAINTVLRRFQKRQVSLIGEQWTRLCVGRKPKEFIPLILDENEILADGIDIDSIVSLKDQFYKATIGDQAKAIVRPGVIEFLYFLKGAGKKIALATSTTQDGVSVILGPSGLNVLNLFDFRICGDEVQRAKPNPQIYNKVRHYLGEAFNYLVFEDAASGVAAAKGANMACIAVPNQFTMHQEDLSLATHIITDLTPTAELIIR